MKTYYSHSTQSFVSMVAHLYIYLFYIRTHSLSSKEVQLSCQKKNNFASFSGEKQFPMYQYLHLMVIYRVALVSVKYNH